jgi:hypothetical protein
MEDAINKNSRMNVDGMEIEGPTDITYASLKAEKVEFDGDDEEPEGISPD